MNPHDSIRCNFCAALTPSIGTCAACLRPRLPRSGHRMTLPSDRLLVAKSEPNRRMRRAAKAMGWHIAGGNGAGGLWIKPDS